jgi:hypothetical protein
MLSWFYDLTYPSVSWELFKTAVGTFHGEQRHRVLDLAFCQYCYCEWGNSMARPT